MYMSTCTCMYDALIYVSGALTYMCDVVMHMYDVLIYMCGISNACTTYSCT